MTLADEGHARVVAEGHVLRGRQELVVIGHSERGEVVAARIAAADPVNLRRRIVKAVRWRDVDVGAERDPSE